jgi:hypothetical protein
MLTCRSWIEAAGFHNGVFILPLQSQKWKKAPLSQSNVDLNFGEVMSWKRNPLVGRSLPSKSPLYSVFYLMLDYKEF